jgi:hypothetical protein
LAHGYSVVVPALQLRVDVSLSPDNRSAMVLMVLMVLMSVMLVMPALNV